MDNQSNQSINISDEVNDINQENETMTIFNEHNYFIIKLNYEFEPSLAKYACIEHKVDKTDIKLSHTHDLDPEGYIILDHISTGSFGKVHHAKYTDEDNEIKLAVKIIDTEKTIKGYVSKFLPRELDVIRKINHPYIIYTYSILQKKAVLYIFMAYAEKGNLLQHIMNHGGLKEDQARLWFRNVASAVQYLHAMDIVHRDIKCENILLTNNLTVKLSDFSFSKFIERSKRLNCKTHCYSNYYASPEILHTHPYDGKSSDIWSLGIVLYIMLNNKIPFDAKNIKIMYKQQVKREWSHRPSVEKLMSENLKICIDNILQPEPRKRWTIGTVLNSDWIKMKRKLHVKRTEQESLALVEALETKNKSQNKNDIKKLQIKRSDTQYILNKQSPKYMSIAESTRDQSIANSDSNSSKYKLKRSKRIMEFSDGNSLATNNDLTFI